MLRKIKRKLKRIIIAIKKIIGNIFAKTTLGKIRYVVNSPTYFEGMERKNKFIRYWDMIVWLIKHREVNFRYNAFGLDIKNFRNPNDYLPKKVLQKEKRELHHERINPQKHKILSFNKFVFYSYLSQINEKVVPKLYYMVKGNEVLAPMEPKMTTIEAIRKLEDNKYVCKAVTGEKGASTYIIDKKDSKIIINNNKISIPDFLEAISFNNHLIQEYIIQHEDMSRLNPSSVNTIRIVTTRWNTETHILGALVRIGAEKDSIIDNASQGGTFVGITEDGKLKKYGKYFDKPREEIHPVTGIKYEGYKIPYWKEAVDLVKSLHPYFYGLATIGWDVAITPTGPVILEINSNYCMKMLQMAVGGIKEKWYELKEK